MGRPPKVEAVSESKVKVEETREEMVTRIRKEVQEEVRKETEKLIKADMEKSIANQETMKGEIRKEVEIELAGQMLAAKGKIIGEALDQQELALEIKLDKPLRESFNDIKAEVRDWFKSTRALELSRLIIVITGEEQAGAQNKMITILAKAGLKVAAVDYVMG